MKDNSYIHLASIQIILYLLMIAVVVIGNYPEAEACDEDDIEGTKIDFRVHKPCMSISSIGSLNWCLKQPSKRGYKSNEK